MDIQNKRLELERLIIKHKPEGNCACLYSGGIDSATAHYYWGGEPYTVEWLGYATEDDNDYAKKIIIAKEDVEEELPNIFKCFDRPIVETGIFPLYFAYKRLSNLGYKKIITGDGGDELFLGYKWDKLAWFNPWIQEHELIKHLYGHHVYIAKSISKKFGVDIISPFLVPEVVDFVFNLPLEYKCNFFEHKILLKRLMEDKIPVRPKYYFHNPIQEWLGITRANKGRWFYEQWRKVQS